MGVERRQLSQSCLKEPASRTPHPGGGGEGGDGAECDVEQMQERMQMRNTCAWGAWPGIVADLCVSLLVCADSI